MSSRVLATAAVAVLSIALSLGNNPPATATTHLALPHSHSAAPQLTYRTSRLGTTASRGAVPATQICYNQRDNDDGVGVVSQNFESVYDAYDSQAADDFHLSAACDVTSVTVDGTYLGSGVPASLRVTFYANNNAQPGAIISDQNNLPYINVGGGTLTATIAPVPLNPGTYWISVQVNMDFDPNGEWVWNTNLTQRLNPAMWQNPGNGFASGCSTWTTMVQCVGPAGEGPDLSFWLADNSDTSTTSAVYTGSTAGELRERAEGAGTPALRALYLPYRRWNCGPHADGSSWTVQLQIGHYENGHIVWATITLRYRCSHGVTYIVGMFLLQTPSGTQTWPASLAISPGDKLSMSLTPVGSKTKAVLKDVTTGESAHHSIKFSGVDQFSVGVTNLDENGQQQPLADFGEAGFKKVYVEGQPMGALDPQAVTMVDANGNPLAVPGQLKNGSQFTVTYTGPTDTIDTYGAWDGSQDVIQFGCPDTTTYGEVITIPPGDSKLFGFTFPWINLNSGSMVVRGELYAWDGSEATGPALFESAPQTISFNDGAFHDVSFNVPSATVTPGAQYVVFASIDKDYELCTDGYSLGWGAVDDSVYPDGTFVFQNNGGDESQWTTAPWSTFGIDLALDVQLAP